MPPQASVGWARRVAPCPRAPRNVVNGLNVAAPIASPRNRAHYDSATTRDVSAGDARSNPWPRLSQSSRLLRVRMVQSQRRHERRLDAGRNAGAVFMSKDGLHGLRADRSRCTAELVAAYEQAAVVMVRFRGAPGAASCWPSADTARVKRASGVVFYCSLQ
jgi:hypothetical protein